MSGWIIFNQLINIWYNYVFTFRTTNSTLTSAEISLTRKYCFSKPSTQQLKKVEKKLIKEDDKCMEREINLMETDAPIVDTSEIGCVIFFIIFFGHFKKFYRLFVTALSFTLVNFIVIIIIILQFTTMTIISMRKNLRLLKCHLDKCSNLTRRPKMNFVMMVTNMNRTLNIFIIIIKKLTFC